MVKAFTFPGKELAERELDGWTVSLQITVLEGNIWLGKKGNCCRKSVLIFTINHMIITVVIVNHFNKRCRQLLDFNMP